MADTPTEITVATVTTNKSTYTTNDGNTVQYSTSTTVQVDSSGKYVPGSTNTTLLDANGNTVGTIEAGEGWEFTSYATTDVQKTLANRNSGFNRNLTNHIATALQRDDNTGIWPFKGEGVNDLASAQAALGASTFAAEEPDLTPSGVDYTQEVNSNIPSKGVRLNYPVLHYPEDIKVNKQDRIKFTMKTHEGAILRGGLGEQNIGRREGVAINGSVTLPIPGKVDDSNKVRFSEGRLNPFEAMLVSGSMNIMNQNTISDAGQSIMRMGAGIDQAFRRNTSYNDALKVYLAQKATGTRGLLSRATGAILNPNLELLFDSPELRDFSFIFRMSPRHKDEATIVKQIIRFFKQGMSIKSTADSTFLKTPNVFDIKYQSYEPNGNLIDHKSINRIKTCALTNCAVNYTPDGSYMTFTDSERTMTAYELTLQFRELTPLYEEDYNEPGLTLTEIGF